MFFKKEMTSVQKLVFAGLLAALGTIINFIQIPYFVPYLKLDVSEVVVLIGTEVSLGVGLVIAVIKFLMIFLMFPADPIGNFTLLFGSLIIAFSYYCCRKKCKMNPLFSLIITSLIFVVLMVVANYFYITPAYSGATLAQMQAQQDNYLNTILITYIPFNIIKITVVSILFYALQKRLFGEAKNA